MAIDRDSNPMIIDTLTVVFSTPCYIEKVYWASSSTSSSLVLADVSGDKSLARRNGISDADIMVLENMVIPQLRVTAMETGRLEVWIH